MGNSSSGIIEAPSFNIGTINIGIRQKGRVKGLSIIDCNYSINDINRAINKLYDCNFRKIIDKTKNPYDSGGGSKDIIKIISSKDLSLNPKKKFYDL